MDTLGTPMSSRYIRGQRCAEFAGGDGGVGQDAPEQGVVRVRRCHCLGRHASGWSLRGPVVAGLCLCARLLCGQVDRVAVRSPTSGGCGVERRAGRTPYRVGYGFT